MNAQPDLTPSNIEAEQQVLGAILSDNDLAHRITGILAPEHFYDPVHARLYSAILERVKADRIASPVTMMEVFRADEGLQQLGGSGYLINLVGAAISTYAVKDTALTVVEMAQRRRVVEVCRQAQADIAADRPAEEVIAALEMFTHTHEPTEAPRSMSLLSAQINLVQEQIQINDGESPAIPTGLVSLDEALSMRRGRYTILAGGTSMGKTAMGLHLAYAAAKSGLGVGFVSREMPERDLAARINAIESQIPYKAFERRMSPELTRKMVEAAKAQESLPIRIFSNRVDDMASIWAEAKKLQRAWRDGPTLALLVVDYIQLIRGRGTSFEVLSQVANDLKQLAKVLDVHVLALAQIDRKVMERDNARPMLSDLRGSGDLENAPDNVVFVYRHEYFCERAQRPSDIAALADFEAEWSAAKGKMEIIIAKARMGEIKTVKIGCDMATNRFFDTEVTGDMF